MYRSPVASRIRSFFRTALLVVGVALAAFPAFSQIRSVQGRVIQAPTDVVLTRKARFLPGDILGQPMVSLTIKNDATPATLLLEMEIDFGGTWDADYLRVRFVVNMTSGQSLIFTNASILSDTDLLKKVRTASTYGFEYSDSLLTHTNISGMDQILNISSLQLPEGTYKISLKAYQITLSDTNDINSSISDMTQKGDMISAEFNVVSIGDIGSIVLPTLTSPVLSFQVPEIPVYNDSRGTSTSSTKVTIKGPTEVPAYTVQKAHARSTAGSSAIKGYPSDLPGGVVTYDLSSYQFRAGQTYSIDLSFDDWNIPPANIASKTTSVSFPAPRISQNATVSADYKASFSWGFTGTDYSSWVKEYRIYLNGQYKGFTTDTRYDLAETLTPGTTYQWYVMPMNRDGSAFFAAPVTQSFTTNAHTELAVRIDSPAPNSTLILGSSYGFSGSATFSNGATLSSATWKFGTETKTGMSVSYTPSRRFAANSLPVTLSVTDSLGLTRTTQAINLTVLDPAVAISGAQTRTANTGAAVAFAVDTGNSRDIASYEWFADGSSAGTGSTKSISFAGSGTHRVYVQGVSAPDVGGNTKTVRSAEVVVTVAGAGPTVAITQPAAGGELILGNSVRVIASVTNENPLRNVTWTVAGPDTGQNGAVGSTLNFAPGQPGEYTLTATAVDTFDKSASASTRILVNDASVAITSPTANAVLALSGTLSPVIQAPNADRIVWFVDSTQMSGSSVALSSIGTGTHSLRATAYWNTMDTEGRPAEYSENSATVSFVVRDTSPPVVAITFPQAGMTLKTGETYRFSADVNSLSGLSQSYWEVGGVRLTSNTYTPPTSGAPRSLTITHRALNPDRIEGSASVQVGLINPAVFLQAPASTEFAAGSTIPLAATAVDSRLYWIVDGVELGSWNRIFTEAGAHTVRAGWRAQAVDSSGTEREFSGESQLLTFSIYSTQPPSISEFTPSNSPILAVLGSNVSFSVVAAGANPIQSIAWTVLSGTASAGTGTGNSFAFRFANAGQYTVRAVASDSRGLTTQREWTVKIIDPQVAIAYPTQGAVFATGAVPTPTVTTKDVVSYSLILDGTVVPAGFNWNSLAVGNHTLAAEGFYATTGQGAQQKVSAAPVQFRVEDRTPPTFTIQGIRDGDRIIAGKLYTFSVQRSGNETIQWIRNGSPVSGSGTGGTQYSFTPAAGDGEIPFAVRGTLNSITTEQTFRVRVIDPYVSILLPAALSFQGQYPSGVALPLQTERRDVDRFEWMVDLQSYSGSTVIFQPGTHTVSVRAFAAGVRLPTGNYGEYEYAGAGAVSKTLVVAGKPAISAITVPASAYAGESVTAGVTISGDQNGQLVSSLTYYVDGRVYRQERAPVATSIAIAGLAAGRHTVSATLVDVFGNASSREASTTVYAPLSIAILQPATGAKLSPDSAVAVALGINSGSFSTISWSIDGSAVPNSNFTAGSLGRLSPGTHTISAQALDPLGRATTASVSVEVQSDFQLSLAAPAPGTSLIVGNEITARVEFERVAGSQVDLTDAARYVSWYINGTDSGSKGLAYNFSSATEGEFTIQARYSKSGMLRSTDERRVTVRDIAAPAILKPVNGSRIVYSQGGSVQLSATGEPGATFAWSLDGTAIAMGAETSFVPAGVSGQRQLRLVTTAAGRTKERLATVTFVPNTPPALSFAAPAVQYVGETLVWTLSAFDAEDGAVAPRVDVAWDGIPLAAGAARILVAADAGVHVLSARAVDSFGAAVSGQTSVTVERSDLGLKIQSPLAGATQYSGYEVQLAALLANQPLTGAASAGTYQWTVQYLDDPSIPAQNFSGRTVSFRPAGLGEVAVAAKYVDGSGRERGSDRISIRVEREPVNLSIAWPHGTVVEEGAGLSPSVIGLPAGAYPAAVTWSLNGVSISDIGNFRAPSVSGAYTLIAQYARNGAVDRAQLEFRVNTKPKLAITSPQEGSQAVAGTPLVFAAKVEDDQGVSGAVTWKDAGGTILGEGNPWIGRDFAAGTYRLQASAVDEYGSAGVASVNFTVYAPVVVSGYSVNNDLPVYPLEAGGAPLAARVEFTGGIAPQATWTLRQGERAVPKTGREAAFQYTDLSTFGEEPATMTLVVSDAGLADESAREVYRKDFALQISRNATANLASPAAGQVLRAGDPVQVQVLLTGFSSPAIRMSLNAIDLAAAWTSLEGTSRYGAVIPGQAVSAEGVYNLLIEVSENGTSRQIPYTMNVYARRTGIFVDQAPAEIDLEASPVRVEAVLEGLQNIDSIVWRTDLSAAPVATGPGLDLGQAGLSPGERSITAQAISGTTVVSSFSFGLKVFGPMALEVTPQSNPLIVQRGADVTLEAAARDRDGLAIAGQSVTWTSHVDGVLGHGTSLALGDLADLSAGDHVITVEAAGAYGRSITVLLPLRVNLPPSESGSGDQGGGGQPGEPEDTFDSGEEVDSNLPNPGSGIFGPGGGAPDQDLLDMMRGFTGGAGFGPGGQF